jgi:hypothetical protein
LLTVFWRPIRCGELNFNGVVEAQIAVFESELLDDTLVL